MNLPNQDATAVDFQVTVPANGTETINHSGSFVRVVAANGPFRLRLGDKAPFTLLAGSQYSSPDGKGFPFVGLVNDNAYPLVVTVIIGSGDVSSDSSPQPVPRTQLVAQTETTLTAGTGLTLPGTPSGNLTQRKAVFVSNIDANLNIEIRDSAGNGALTVFAGTASVIETSDEVQVFNSNGTDVQVRISETWYLAQ